jgi:polyferredoxin
MIPSFVLIALAFFDSGPLIEREKVRKILKIVGYGIGALFLLFFVVFGLGYYNVVPSLYNVNIFAAFGYLITAFMLIYVFISYISREKQ